MVELSRMWRLDDDICERLDSLVFSDRDNKLKTLSYNPSMFAILWDVKEIAHYLQRVGDGVPSVVVSPWR